MNLSDYVANFLAKHGIRHVFAISGGASIHLIHSVADTPGITYVCLQHEQACAMAADAYSRVTGNLGAAIATSGPGATNMLTGVCGAYYDSVPVIYITGQVATFRTKGNTGVRQMGFQEADIVDVYKPITKYAVRVDSLKKIRYELEKACYLATSGRPGPVLVDIPDDLQRAPIKPDDLEVFVPESQTKDLGRLCDDVDRCIKLLENAKRPVVILGWGIRLAKADKEAEEFVNELGFPVAPTWATADMFCANHPLLVGTFGTHGTRYANFAVQNADLILSIGTRLDTKLTGSPMATFAREAKKIVVDIDPCELNKFEKFGMNVELLINADAKDFLRVINQKVAGIAKQDISVWIQKISQWKKSYPICPPEYYEQKEVNPYIFVKTLSKEATEGDTIVVDTGCAVAWMMQAFDFKADQRLYHDWNNTAMGWALPASIGTCFALGRQPVICVTGDGSLQMNIQELATVLRHQLPIKIFLINNHGYSMIQQTQDQWFGSKYIASTVEGGLAFPDFVKVAKSYGYKTLNIFSNRKLGGCIREALDTKGPVFCNVEISPEHRVIPQVKFGRPNEDAAPLLSRKEFFEGMIVKSLEVSLLGQEVNLLDTHPKTVRDYDKRAFEKTPEIIRIAKQFGKEFFDGDRKCGYGGYKYDGRWKSVVKRMKDYYKLADNAAILDVGCAKGFMLHDFKELMPNATMAGIDVSKYAIENAIALVKPFLKIASAEKLPYPDKSFDLVVSINSIHNLPLGRLKTALREIQRVCRGNSYVTIDAWHNETERENLSKWVLTAETMMHVDDWKKLFAEVGYTGDYWWFIAE